MSGSGVPDERWTSTVVLKRDVFSTIERGRFRGPDGEVDAVMRRIDQTPWWSRPVARHLFNRERRALEAVNSLDSVPTLLSVGRRALVRQWIDGVALHIARPRDAAYFRSAKEVLRKLHRLGICHNDLAKPQNWLHGRDGRAYVTDFQLAIRFRRRSKLFRIAAYEDLRHLLKQKRRYAPELLTPAEHRVLARKSVIAKALLTYGKPVYHLITRGILNFTDREGGGPRLVNDAPRLAEAIRKHPQVRDVAIVAYPDRRNGVGLYAFVAAADGLNERALRDFIGQDKGPLAPEYIKLSDDLPRDRTGAVRIELLQLVALNQLDLIPPLLDEPEQATITQIIANRRNLLDRFESRSLPP